MIKRIAFLKLVRQEGRRLRFEFASERKYKQSSGIWLALLLFFTDCEVGQNPLKRRGRLTCQVTVSLNLRLDPCPPPGETVGVTMAIANKGRLTQPLVRENGGHRPATWEEALDRVERAFRRSITKNDPRDFGMFSCSKTTNELNYVAQKFVRSVMRTNNIDSCNRT